MSGRAGTVGGIAGGRGVTPTAQQEHGSGAGPAMKGSTMTAPRWPLHSYLALGALPTAAPCARLHARVMVAEWGLTELAQVVELIISDSLNLSFYSFGPFWRVLSVGDGWDAEVCRGDGSAGDLGEFVFGSGEADLESFHFAEPAFALGFGDAGGEVVADLGEALFLGGVGPEHGAADAGVLVGAGGRERAPAGSGGDLAAFEMAEELLPFLVGGGAVFLAGAQRPAAGEEGPVGLDGLVGVDGLVAHGDVDVAVAGDDLGDVRGKAVEDGVGDEHPAEVVGRVDQQLAGDRAEQAGAGDRGGEHPADGSAVEGLVVAAEAALEQQRGRRHPAALVVVVG